MKSNYNKNGWEGELIMCPSQINKTFTIENKEYHFYLRWRWDDPWTVECNDIFLNEEFSLYYSHDNLEKLLNWIERHLKEIILYVNEHCVG
jgi:hypothetical protein